MTASFRQRFPNTRLAATQARRAVVAHIADYGFAPQDLSDIETAVGEALANAAEHGHKAESAFDVRVHVERDRLIVEVQDGGSGFAGRLDGSAPAHDAPRGFGIYLMRHLMDEVDFIERGTCVRLAKRLPIAKRNGTATLG
jgi:anti-sigma regulatory factor (Ser/Thr protein kinase)